MAAKRWVVVWMISVVCLLAGFQPAFGAMELPEKLKQVPLYPGSTMQQVMDAGIQAMAIFGVKADQDALVDFYRKDLNSKGWKIVAQFEEADGAGITFSKDRQLIQIAVKKGEEAGTLQYQLIFISEK